VEFPGAVTQSGWALVNAPSDIGLGGFRSTTHEPVEITDLTLVAPDAGFKIYRKWTANSCSAAALVIHFNGDPRLVVNSGSPSFRVYPFQSISVPPIGARPTVPPGEGPICSALLGGSPLYYIYEIVPTKSGVHDLKGFNVTYTWDGNTYQQYEPYGFEFIVRAHKYWKGPPTLARLWGRGLPDQ
jgi:hypothetical protein